MSKYIGLQSRHSIQEKDIKPVPEDNAWINPHNLPKYSKVDAEALKRKLYQLLLEQNSF